MLTETEFVQRFEDFWRRLESNGARGRMWASDNGEGRWRTGSD